MSFFKQPMAYQQRQEHPALFAQTVPIPPSAEAFYQPQHLQHMPASSHSSHPPLPHLTLLVFEAVLEVVCVSLPGYIIARQGMFSTEMQKFTANLNVALFTPCLIFVKLASKLTLDKLADLAIIPLIFLAQTLVSFLCSILISKAFRLTKRPRNFVVAMGVFGNSNSLPISLVISLSKTISGLHWDKVPHDNDGEVQARGILYLLVFQQLGQMLRWSWGYNVLLAPPNQEHGSIEDGSSQMGAGTGDGLHEHEGVPEERAGLLDYSSELDENEGDVSGSDETHVEAHTQSQRISQRSRTASKFTSGVQTPVTYQDNVSPLQANRAGYLTAKATGQATLPCVAGPSSIAADADQEIVQQEHATKPLRRLQRYTAKLYHHSRTQVGTTADRIRDLVRRLSLHAFESLPTQSQKCLTWLLRTLRKFGAGVWEFMNPPLWAMLAAIVVASIPDLQHLFFAQGTFVKNSVTGAITQSGNVAVPLILVVLGGNLARNTMPSDGVRAENPSEERKLVIASILSRMLLPFCIMAPLLALTAKYVPVSILDDPIFVIVCFLITGAPSALQLAQICQINNVYVGAMTSLLFQSYVVWILPSTLILVMCALEVVEWAKLR